MKVGDIVHLVKQGRAMIGFVVKVYDDTKFFVKSVSDNFADFQKKSSWSRYGIGVNEGLYVHSNATDLTVIPQNVMVVEESTFVTHSDKDITIHRGGAWTVLERNSMLTTTVFQFDASKYDVLSSDKSFTYVYLDTYDVGAFAPGVSETSRQLAGYHARRTYLDKLIENCEDALRWEGVGELL